jgi:hypothetical protein
LTPLHSGRLDLQEGSDLLTGQKNVQLNKGIAVFKKLKITKTSLSSSGLYILKFSLRMYFQIILF